MYTYIYIFHQKTLDLTSSAASQASPPLEAPAYVPGVLQGANSWDPKAHRVPFFRPKASQNGWKNLHILTMTNMWISSDWPWTMYVDFSGVLQVISPNKAAILLILSVDLGILTLSLVMNWCDSSHTYEFGNYFAQWWFHFIQRGVTTVWNIFITISKMGLHSLTFVTNCGSTDSWLRPSIRKRTVLRCRNI